VKTAAPKAPVFDAEAFLNASGPGTKAVKFRPSATIYAQGSPADSVLFVQKGNVRLSVLAGSGKEAVVGVIGPGDFFGEGALAGQPVRLGTATAMSSSTVLVVPLPQMKRLLQEQHPLSDRFLAHMLARNSRLEADLVDQLFNNSEKRLARTLLLLARYGKLDGPRHVLPKMSQEVLAEIVGTTRSRVNVFMNKFRKLGFIEYNGDIIVHHALLSVVLHDTPTPR
jgi:CRP/FNR family transcriptional regulator, cyclic AMP receptor protein